MDRGERERGEGCWFLTDAQLLSVSSPFMRSSLVMRCCLGAGLSDESESGLRRFRVRRRMICSPLFCLMMFRGLGVCKAKETQKNEQEGRELDRQLAVYEAVIRLHHADNFADLINKCQAHMPQHYLTMIKFLLNA